MMTLPQSGGCLCGGLRSEITQPPIVTYTCHCTVCQQLTGSAFSFWRSWSRPRHATS
jgi:adenylate cyclase